MAKIRNPAAFAAWLARKQMAETQQQNVQTYDQQGVQATIAQPQLMEALLQQAAAQQVLSQQQVKKRETPLGVYNELFEGATPIGGYNKRKAAYQDLNLGFGGNEK
jgi:uridylate kinase